MCVTLVQRFEPQGMRSTNFPYEDGDGDGDDDDDDLLTKTRVAYGNSQLACE